MRRLLFAAALVVVPSLAAAQPKLPDYLTLPAGLTAADVVDEAFGEADFPKPDHGENIQRGHHWHASLTLAGVPDDAAGKTLWARIKPALSAGGWTVAAEFDENPFSAVARLQKGRSAWAYFVLFNREDIRFDLVEAALPRSTLSIAPPRKTPETVSVESGDFPYLPPLPGSRFLSGRSDPTPMEVRLPGSDEVQLVGTAVVMKDYEPPAGLSTIEFATTYRDALTAGGWNVIASSQGLNQSDAAVTAHYAKDGRDIWAYLHFGAGDLSLHVADAGAVDLAQVLKKECRVPLYGVMFDFNKSTLKGESDAVLARAAGAIRANAGLGIEVQGHTDNVGADAYNLTLSEARAQSVRDWLVAHGVGAAQLTSKGYGKTKPIADNGTDAGRAKNRRVELACRP